MQDAAFARANDDVLWVRSTRVASNYFEALNQPIVAGRMFTAGEAEHGRPVAVVVSRDDSEAVTGVRSELRLQERAGTSTRTGPGGTLAPEHTPSLDR